MSKETKMNTVSAESRAVMGELLAAFEQFKQANDQRLLAVGAGANRLVLGRLLPTGLGTGDIGFEFRIIQRDGRWQGARSW